jgi:hypothetical protein
MDRESHGPWIDVVAGWRRAGMILEEQEYALLEETRRRESIDPYEGVYAEGPPADAWAHVYPGRIWVVNEYRLTREWGGAEEGGWWYTLALPTQILAGPFHDVSDADEVAGHLQAFATTRNVGDMYSMGGGHQWSVRAESCVPHWPVAAVYS